MSPVVHSNLLSYVHNCTTENEKTFLYNFKLIFKALHDIYFGIHMHLLLRPLFVHLALCWPMSSVWTLACCLAEEAGKIMITISDNVQNSTIFDITAIWNDCY